jgi:hypothetical protein
MTDSPLKLGLVNAARFLPVIFLSLFAGFCVTASPRRKSFCSHKPTDAAGADSIDFSLPNGSILAHLALSIWMVFAPRSIILLASR